jgi:CRISPR-associated protein Csa1
MISWFIRRQLRRLHEIRELDPVPGELRGWSWDKPPVKPRAYLGLGVSEIAYSSQCGFRDLWLRRRKGVRAEASEHMRVGYIVHEIFHRAARDLRSIVFSNGDRWAMVRRLYDRAWLRVRDLTSDRWAVELYRKLVSVWLGESMAAELLNGGEGLGWIPWLSEYRVDGSAIGLSRHLRVDGLSEMGLVVEIKYGKSMRWHRVALAGYALAMESYMEVPVDYGILVHVNNVTEGTPTLWVEPIYISPDLRRSFLEARDEAIDVLLSPVEPPQSACVEDEVL